MTDEFEDRLRRHLTDRAAMVEAEPDPAAFVERSTGRARPRGLVASGLTALVVLVAGAGVLTGVNLVGAGSTAESAASTTTVPGRAGAALAPGGAANSAAPSIVIQTPYTLLFTRVSSSGLTVRAYSTGTAAGSCDTTGSCPPSTTVPGTPQCPPGALCAEPVVTPHASSGASGGAAGSGGNAGAPAITVSPPDQTGGSGTTGSAPPVPPAQCGQLVVELSTDRAVGTGSVAMPTTAPAADAVQILGSGSFGSAEGAPVSWVAVWVGSGVASVQLTVGGAPVDAMTQHDGVVVLALTGGSGLAGASVVGLDQSGATVSTVPASQGIQPADAGSCPSPTVPPTSSTTTTVPAGPPTTSTTSTTTTTGPGAPVPSPTLPVAPQGG